MVSQSEGTTEVAKQPEAGEAPGKWQEKFQSVVEWAISVRRDEIREYVRKLREQNPGITNDDLAQLIVRRKATRNAFVGAITGLFGLPLLPVTIPPIWWCRGESRRR